LIVAEQKPLAEIRRMIAPYQKVLILGCGTCVTVCGAGGDRVADVDAVLSLGCGIGVQIVAERFPDIPVLPGVNTSFMGAVDEWGVWDERCAACGDCRLEETGGICPITRCTKGILNGPCAGTKNGKCEANKDIDCGWVLIYRRLERLGQLDKMRRYYPPRNFRTIPRPKRLVSKANIDVGESDG